MDPSGITSVVPYDKIQKETEYLTTGALTIMRTSHSLSLFR